jgi:uncharacterized protein (TIGR02284 family)
MLSKRCLVCAEITEKYDAAALLDISTCAAFQEPKSHEAVFSAQSLTEKTMSKFTLATALASSVGLAILSSANVQAEEAAQDSPSEVEAEISSKATVKTIKNAEAYPDPHNNLSATEATLEAIAEIDITDKDEAMLSDAARAEISAMNGIISILIDAEALYEQAADMPDDNETVRAVMRQLASERETQTVALQQHVVVLGGEPDQFGEATGTTHRVYAQLRTILDNDTEVAIEEVLRAERNVFEEIGKALTGDISEEGKLVLEALRDEIYTDIKRLEQLDDVA